MAVAPFVVILACLALSGCGVGSEPAATPEPEVVVWAVGDGGADGEPSRRVAELIARDEPEHVIYLGDVYESGSADEFRVFGEVFAPLLKRMWPTPGNHDWPNHADGYDPFWRQALGEPLPHRYERSAGGWQVLSANSETPDDPDQLDWLRSRAGRGGTCRIAFWHRPHLDAGEHEDEQGDVKALWDAVAGRAAIVLNGHDHDLQRFKPVDGTTEYVAGAGGRSRYAVDANDPRLAFSDDQTDAALRIELTPGHADLRYIAADGTVLDDSDVSCEA